MFLTRWQSVYVSEGGNINIKNVAFKPNNVPRSTSPHPKTTKGPWALFTAFACFPFKSVLHGHGSRGQLNTLRALFSCKCQTWSSKTEMIMFSHDETLDTRSDDVFVVSSRELEVKMLSILGSPTTPKREPQKRLGISTLKTHFHWSLVFCNEAATATPPPVSWKMGPCQNVKIWSQHTFTNPYC